MTPEQGILMILGELRSLISELEMKNRELQSGFDALKLEHEKLKDKYNELARTPSKR